MVLFKQRSGEKMNVLVIGCGKLGSRLAGVLCHLGHFVSVLDVSEDSFTMLPEDFDGLTVVGMPMDIMSLKSAGIEGCDAVAVVTSDDNLNIVVAQIVNEFFNVSNVVTRITDPTRDRIFNEFGLKTICQTKYACEAMVSALISNEKEKHICVEESVLSFNVREADSHFIGRSIENVPVHTDEAILGIIKNGKVYLYNDGEKNVINQGDKLIYTKLI